MQEKSHFPKVLGFAVVIAIVESVLWTLRKETRGIYGKIVGPM